VTHSQQPPAGAAAYLAKLKLFTPNARKVLIFSALTGLAFGVSRLMFNFYVLSLGGYDEQFLGFLTSTSSLASLLVALPAAYLADHFPQKRIMLITGAVSALSFLGIVTLTTKFFLILFNLLVGLAASVGQVAIAPFLMRNSSQEERQYVFSFNFGLMTLAGFVGNWLGGTLPGWFAGPLGVAPTDALAYRLTLGSMVLVTALAVAPLTLIRPTPGASGTQVQAMPWAQLWRHAAQLTRFITPQFIIGLGAGLMMPFMNLYYRDVFNRSDAAIGTLFALGSLAMGIAQFMGPPLADRIGKVNSTLVTQGLSVPFLLMLSLAAWLVATGRGGVVFWYYIAALAYLVRLALMNLSNPIYQTFVLEQVKPEIQALSASLIGVAFQFGWAFSPYLSGWFLTTYGNLGFVPITLGTAILYALAVIITWAFFRNAEPRREAS